MMLYDADRAGALKRAASLSPKKRRVAAQIKILMGDQLDIPRSLELYASVWYLLPLPKICTMPIGQER